MELWMNHSETPLWLMIRSPSFYQGANCQVWSSIFDDTWRQRPNQRLPYKFVNRYLCSLLNAVAGTELPPSKIQVQFRTKIRWTRCNFLLWVSVGRSRLWLAYVIQSFLTSYDNFVVHIYHIKSTSYWC